MKFKLIKANKKISIYSRDNVIYRISDGFYELTGYSESTFIGKDIKELENNLRLDSQISFSNLDSGDECFCYLFDSNREPKEVIITSLDRDEDELYCIEDIENPSIKYILENISLMNVDKNKSFALYCLENNVLLQANEVYMDMLESLNLPTDNLAGRLPILNKFLMNEGGDIKYGIETEVEFRNKAGALVYYDLSVIPLYIDGKEKYILNTIFDVTDKVLLRKALEKQKGQLETILNNVSDKIGIVNKSGEYIYKNKACKNIIRDSLNKEDLKDVREMYENIEFYNLEGFGIPFDSMPAQKVLRDEEFSDYIILGTTGDSTLCHRTSGIPLYDKKGNLYAGVLIYENITDKMVLEEYNSFREKSKHSFLNYVSISYPDYKILYINEQGCRTLRDNNSRVKNRLSLIGKDFFEFNSLNDDEVVEAKKNISEFIKNKTSPFTYTQEIIKNGNKKYIKTIFHPVYNEFGQVFKLNILGVDVTEDKKKNEELAYALKAKDDAFINASHELKTPLNLIFSAAQLIDSYVSRDDSKCYKKDIWNKNNIITKNSYRLMKLINNILDITKLEYEINEVNLENIDIIAVTEDIIQSVSSYVETKGLDIVFDTDMEEKIIALDLYKFERILLNLLTNAIKFSKTSGSIFIDIRQNDENVELTVKDEGIGLSREDSDKVFDKYFQVNKTLNRQHEGAGIGLSLVKSLVKLHKGDIRVESNLNQGSKFILCLPDEICEDQQVRIYDPDFESKSQIINTELSDIL